MKTDFFAHKAQSYEGVSYRVANVNNIANSILASVHFDRSMHVMDFGSGTGLLLERIAPYVKKVTAIDISSSMNEQLAKKKADLLCELDIIEMDLSKATLDQTFDGIISSMTLHHIEDVGAMLSKLHAMLKPGGFIAIADLDKEDGSFHTEDTGVFHFGFDRQQLYQLAELAGFTNITITTASEARKPQGNYPIFLLSAYK